MTACQATRKRRRWLSDDHGFILVEILVSAVMLVTVSLGAFLLLQNADTAAGNQQKRTLAANVAQSELERIRSLPVEDVADARGTTTFKRSNIKFTETIEAKWVTDGSDEPECTTRSGGLDYMRTTVTISWEGMGAAKPVKMTSYYTPPAGAGGGDTGSASVHITDRNGGPVSGIGVTLAGNQSFSETTNVNGCVVFGFVPAGDYTVKFSRLGYVDGDSNATVANDVKVTAGETNKLQYDYDSGGFTAAKFAVHGAGGIDYPAKPLWMQLFNAAQPTGPKTIPLDGSVGSWNGTTAQWSGNAGVPLFPFTSPYTVYAGNCKGNIPATNATFVNVTPNVFQNAGTVYLPSLNVTVMSGSPAAPGSPVSNATVQFDPGCAPLYERTTNTNGQLAPGDMGFPYSTNSLICAMSNGASGRRYAQAQNNTSFANGGLALTLYLSGTGSKSGGKTGSQTSCFA